MVANFLPLTQTAPTAGAVPSVNLGLGNDLDPQFKRWAVPGGIGGFLLWAIATPSSMPFHEFLHQRGPTQVFVLVMGGMLMAFIINKWRLLQREKKAYLAFDLSIAQAIRSGDLTAVTNQAERSASLVGKRLLRLLDVWSSTGSSFQLERSADSDVELYELSSQSSFSLPKVLLWAIPLLGFIGTVIGMSSAVGSFDAVLSNADNVDGLKNGLTKVTSGLGTAFDTTYLALVVSVIFTFPLNACERLEDRLLSQIDGQVREAVMALSPTGDGEIPDAPAGSGARNQAKSEALEQLTGLASDDLGALISDAFEKHLPDPSVLVEPAQAYADQLTQATLEKLAPLTNLVRDSVEGVAEARLSLQDQADVIRGSMDGLSQELNQSLQALEPVLTRLERLSTGTYTEAERIDQVQALVELRRSIETLNASVARLEPARRRWWGRG
ncbi:MAG: MotA/TolQ/ExbB proton channel family protein [Vulcanococcus sp.]